MSELVNAIMLAAMRRIPLFAKLQLYKQLGSATAVVQNKSDIRAVVPDATERLAAMLREAEEPQRWAEQELQFCIDKGIKVLTFNDSEYPQRLRQCEDAPLVVYYKGTANLNPKHVINIIGTRHSTVYGNDCVRRLVEQLRESCPDTLIVSGLAYGIDICAHRNALDNGLETVAVLAHGLDDLYPHSHRDTASNMISQGGLLTEHPTRTPADKKNFVSRNRIVAGMSDATILVESASKGGGLITANIALSYSRSVFAFPGRVGDVYSEGCNNLLKHGNAVMITSADDLLTEMSWESDKAMEQKRKTGIERQLFPELSAEEQTIVNVLAKENDLQINQLTVDSNIPINRLSSLLFEMEMKGVVRPLAGGIYHLIC